MCPVYFADHATGSILFFLLDLLARCFFEDSPRPSQQRIIVRRMGSKRPSPFRKKKAWGAATDAVFRAVRELKMAMVQVTSPLNGLVKDQACCPRCAPEGKEPVMRTYCLTHLSDPVLLRDT